MEGNQQDSELFTVRTTELRHSSSSCSLLVLSLSQYDIRTKTWTHEEATGDKPVNVMGVSMACFRRVIYVFV